MTKSKGVGRGGRRVNSGRKPSGPIPAKAAAKAVEKRVAKVVTSLAKPIAPQFEKDAVELAKERLARAFATLDDVMDNSPFPAPRVSAAKAIIDIARSEGDGADKGKKAQAAEAAKGAGAGTAWGDDLMSDEPRLN